MPKRARWNSLATGVVELLDAKNADYGDSYRDQNVSRERQLYDLTVRLRDKVERLRTLSWAAAQRPECLVEPRVQESVEDTLRDLAGYAILGLDLLAEDGCQTDPVEVTLTADCDGLSAAVREVNERFKSAMASATSGSEPSWAEILRTIAAKLEEGGGSDA